jgi:hypothetical protein
MKFFASLALLGLAWFAGQRLMAPGDLRRENAVAVASVIPDRVVGNIRYGKLPAYGTYWRTRDTLGVYDRRPELGILAQQLSDGEVAEVKALGMRLVRLTIRWADVEPTPGAFNRVLDHHYRQAYERGSNLELLVVIHTTPDAYNLPHTSCGPNDADGHNRRFAAFMAKMARTYPKVRLWQLGNEMDAGGWPGRLYCDRDDNLASGKRYARMLQTVYPTIRKANPNARVVIGALAGTENWNADRSGLVDSGSWSYARGIYAGGGAAFFDIMAVHSYGITAAGSVDHDVMGVRRVMDSFGDHGRPIWLTEFGHSATHDLYDGQRKVYRPWPHNAGADDAETFDRRQKEWWEGAVSYLQTSGQLVKAIGFSMESTDGNGSPDNHWYAPPGGKADTMHIPRHRRKGYGFGIVRYAPGQTSGHPRERRPAYAVARNRNTQVLSPAAHVGDLTLHLPDRNPLRRYTRKGEWVTIHDVYLDNLVPTEIATTRRKDESGDLLRGQTLQTQD